VGRPTNVRRAAQLLRPATPRKLRPWAKKELRWEGRRRPGLWALGFLSEAAELYDFETHGYEPYLSDRARFGRTPRINPGNLRTVLDNKLAWHDRLAAAGLAHCKTNLVGVLWNGNFYPANGDRSTFAELLRAEPAIVVKPIAGAGGDRLQLIRRTSRGLTRNGGSTTVEELEEHFAKQPAAVVERMAFQHAYAADIYPRTTNTVRFLTMRDARSGEPFIAAAVHRIGSRRSYPADNWTRGGLSCHIDLETGVLGPGAHFPKPPPLTWHDVHPDSGAKVAGVKLPHWDATLGLIREVSRRLSFLPYVGWDLVITEDGPRLIEGNHSPDVDVLQIHGPLLLDPRVRRFYRHHGVI
jgi:hypothetical protein